MRARCAACCSLPSPAWCLSARGISAVRHLHQPAAAAPAYVGTDRPARACHEAEYRNWQDSDHRHAMEVADSQSVLGDFNDARFDHFGTESRFFTRTASTSCETDNAEGQLETFPVAYTFGHYPLQQYLIAFPDGRLQALSIAGTAARPHEGGQRWFHLYPDEKIAHDDPLHWTGAFQNWNSRCASCHSTNLVKELLAGHRPLRHALAGDQRGLRGLPRTGLAACRLGQWQALAARTRAWSREHQQGVGAARRHAAHPATGGHAAQPVNCRSAPAATRAARNCSSRTSRSDYFDNYSLSPLLDGRYFADGQMREEVYVTGSFLQSRMHANHVSCTNCHEPHSGKAARAPATSCACNATRPQKYQTSSTSSTRRIRRARSA